MSKLHQNFSGSGPLTEVVSGSGPVWSGSATRSVGRVMRSLPRMTARVIRRPNTRLFSSRAESEPEKEALNILFYRADEVKLSGYHEQQKP